MNDADQMKRIERLVLDNHDLNNQNGDLRRLVLGLKIQKSDLEKELAAAREGKTLVPIPSYGLDALKALIDWHEKPNQPSLSAIVEKTRIAVRSIEEKISEP